MLKDPTGDAALLRDQLRRADRPVRAHRRLRRARRARVQRRSRVLARHVCSASSISKRCARASRADPPRRVRRDRSRGAADPAFTSLLLGSVHVPAAAKCDRGSDRAAASMRATVRSCTQTLSAGHASLLHRLSGGLDSSIVAGCLARASTQPRIACYTYFNPQGRSDERPWARLAAEHSGFEHLECPVIPAEISFADLVRARPATEPCHCCRT